jgi:hypothetical protein
VLVRPQSSTRRWLLRSLCSLAARARLTALRRPARPLSSPDNSARAAARLAPRVLALLTVLRPLEEEDAWW